VLYLIQQLSIIIHLKIHIMQTVVYLMRYPGGENEGGGTAPENEETKAGDQNPDAAEKPKQKGFIDKVKDALKEWSNDDQLDQEIDDATP
jgi:hypothetical protein